MHAFLHLIFTNQTHFTNTFHFSLFSFFRGFFFVYLFIFFLVFSVYFFISFHFSFFFPIFFHFNQTLFISFHFSLALFIAIWAIFILLFYTKLDNTMSYTETIIYFKILLIIYFKTCAWVEFFQPQILKRQTSV